MKTGKVEDREIGKREKKRMKKRERAFEDDGRVAGRKGKRRKIRG